MKKLESSQKYHFVREVTSDIQAKECSSPATLPITPIYHFVTIERLSVSENTLLFTYFFLLPSTEVIYFTSKLYSTRMNNKLRLELLDFFLGSVPEGESQEGGEVWKRHRNVNKVGPKWEGRRVLGSQLGPASGMFRKTTMVLRPCLTRFSLPLSVSYKERIALVNFQWISEHRNWDPITLAMTVQDK